jgi:hypothetical protein
VRLGADGKTLTMEVTTTAAFATASAGQAEPRTASSSLVYTKITDVGPCEKWPTPCKRFP